jgi:hypothetical protein
VFRGTNPGTVTEIPANGAGNSVAVPALRRDTLNVKSGTLTLLHDKQDEGLRTDTGI